MLIVPTAVYMFDLLISVDPRDCGPPPEITNGNVIGGFQERYQHGNRMEYECDTPFTLVGSKEIECLDGQWSSLPSCIGNLPTTMNIKLW